MVRRVCVIGGGASGLVATWTLVRHGLSVQTFEAANDVGGLWSAAMYDGLRTNLPADVMQFTEFPFQPNARARWLSRAAVADYLVDFADRTSARAHVACCRRVEFVGYNEATDTEARQFHVFVRDTSTNDDRASAITHDTFDAVVVANGHFSRPFWPTVVASVRSSSHFAADIVIEHSHDYRRAEHYRDKTVLVIGAGHSGIDISGEICAFAQRVYLSKNSADATYIFSIIERLRQADKRVCVDYETFSFVEEIVAISPEGSVHISDGTVLAHVDVVLCATGYQHDFPFLAVNDQAPEYRPPPCMRLTPVHVDVTCEGKVVSPLFAHAIHARHNGRVAFLTVPHQIIPFTIAEAQSEWIARILTGHCVLPSADELEHEMIRDNATTDRPTRLRHRVSMAAYVREIARRWLNVDERFQELWTCDDERRVRRARRSIASRTDDESAVNSADVECE